MLGARFFRGIYCVECYTNRDLGAKDRDVIGLFWRGGHAHQDPY